MSFALPSSSALRPSMSRRFTSLPRLAPTMRPSELTTSTTSGSGLFHCEAGCTPTSTAVPTVASTGALVKTSASGPIPTSRYWLHQPRSSSRAFRAEASSDPGRRSSSEPPMVARISERMAAAASWSPRARSSITRSIIDTGNVTPAALTTCRSIGESSHGRDLVPGLRRRVRGELVEGSDHGSGCRGERRSRIGLLGQGAHGGERRRHVDDAVGAQCHHHRAGEAGTSALVGEPRAAREGAGVPVVGQQPARIRRPWCAGHLRSCVLIRRSRCPAGRCVVQRRWKTPDRFSAKAARPSSASSVAKVMVCRSRS